MYIYNENGNGVKRIEAVDTQSEYYLMLQYIFKFYYLFLKSDAALL